MSSVADRSNSSVRKEARTFPLRNDSPRSSPKMTQPNSPVHVKMSGCIDEETAGQESWPSDGTTSRAHAERVSPPLAAACPSGSSALEIPSTHPAVSGSRSLTTLIRDLHAEFAELDEVLKTDPWTSPLPSEAEGATDHSADSLSHLHAAVDSFSSTSLLDELDLVAATVRALPIPRPPSLSVAEWESVLDSPPITISSASIGDQGYLLAHVNQSEVEPQEELLTNMVRVTTTASNRRLNFLQRLEIQDLPNLSPNPAFPCEVTTLDVDVSARSISPATISVDTSYSRSLSHASGTAPSKTRSFKDILSLKRVTSPVQPRELPVNLAKIRSRGLSFPIQSRWRAGPEEVLASSHPLPDPVSFLFF